MTRESAWQRDVAKIKVTDMLDHCILMGIDSKLPPQGWQPRAEGLMADDWIVLDS